MNIVKPIKTPLKDMIVEYIGEKLQPKNDEITYEMVVSVLAEEFPEVMIVVAEENYLRGYKQAILDSEDFEKAYEEFHNSEPEQQA